jgi:hypothetical protein
MKWCPLRNVPISTSLDGVSVSGVIESLYPNGMTVIIEKPFGGLGTSLHVPHFAMYPVNWLATLRGRETVALTERGRQRAEWLLRRVLIIDLDAHCGGGTYSIVRDWPEVVHLDVAVSAFDSYEPSPGNGSTLDIVKDVSDYLPTLRRRLESLDAATFDLVLYGAGVDCHEANGGPKGLTYQALASVRHDDFLSRRAAVEAHRALRRRHGRAPASSTRRVDFRHLVGPGVRRRETRFRA